MIAPEVDDTKTKQSATPLQYRKEIFHLQLRRKIKRKLYSGLRNDPAIRIKLAVDQDVQGLGAAITKTRRRWKTIYKPTTNRLLDSVLGEKWDERIFNECGDFAFVIKGTVCYWLEKAKPFKEYKLIAGQYVRCEIERYCIVFTFVRGDGNKYSYKNFNC